MGHDFSSPIKSKHSKLEFRDRDGMLNALESVNGGRYNDFSWIETDFCCGYNFSLDEWVDAHYDYRRNCKDV